MALRDVMAIWPAADFGYTGGCLSISDGWVWLVNNWYNSGQRLTALTGFQTPRDASPWNPWDFAGMTTAVFSYQSPSQRHLFGNHSYLGWGTNWGTVRWGFIWNENDYWNYGSCDAWSGIGVSRAFGAFGNGGKSAGDNFGCCGGCGYNRAMQCELYGR